MLLESADEHKDKDFKITAFDIGKENIAMAKCGIIALGDIGNIYNSNDATTCKIMTRKGVFDNNFQKIPCSDFIAGKITGVEGEKTELYKMSDSLRQSIKFEVKDAIDFAKEKFKAPIAFLFRNVWPYLKDEATDELVQNISENFPQESIVVLGKYDQRTRTMSNLMDRGFDVLDRDGLILIRK